MRSHIAGPVRLVLLAVLALAVAPIANAQPDPAPAAAPQFQIDSAEVNLTLHPSFNFVVAVPTVLRFEAFAADGQQLLHIWAISRVDSIAVRIRKAASYQAEHAGIFTPLIEPPNTEPALAYVDRAEFKRAVEQALRDLHPDRRLSYHRRLT